MEFDNNRSQGSSVSVALVVWAPRTGTAAAPEKLLEMQLPGPCPRSAESETPAVDSELSVLADIPGHSEVLRLENNCSLISGEPHTHLHLWLQGLGGKRFS